MDHGAPRKSTASAAHAQPDAVDDTVQSPDLLGRVTDTLRDQVEESPYTVVLLAVGAGIILGGGLPAWAVRAGVAVGGRALVAQAIASLIK